ncbi:1-phosphatidylinositol-4,5-bisphosphate phosphodiesterase beta-2 [Gossypium australe]|uniref:1-phosphatidylinositol-4,5-bisphosphate phosphodiesterase beta-2 n=1 Tax=Gossypium australe TaxID=47621 RepID=A0A5B6VUY4_9ROSI|nr:1-phosphatidylinositol-4,5-bisphosphate phosphodiesterase beta-2 [Gossypium australe]
MRLISGGSLLRRALSSKDRLGSSLRPPSRGSIYVDAHRREFLNLTQRDRSVAEYEAKFLRLSRYARGMVATEYERFVHFEDGLKDNLRVLIALQRERDFAALVDKAKIAKEVKHIECQNRERELGLLLLLLDSRCVLTVVDAIRASVGKELGLFEVRFIRAPYQRVFPEVQAYARFGHGFYTTTEGSSVATKRPWSGQRWEWFGPWSESTRQRCWSY